MPRARKRQRLSQSPDPEPAYEAAAAVDLQTEETTLAAYDAFAEEYHDIVEQLPLELQRNYHLLAELEQQMQSSEQGLRAALRQYLTKLGKPPTRSALSAQDAAAVQHSALESDGSDDHDSGVELEQHLSPNLAKRKGVKHTSTSLAGHLIGGYGSSAALASIAQHARTSIRHGEDKVALAVTMYDWVDRHIRRLDADLTKYEDSLVIGLRSGTLPSADAGLLYAQSRGRPGALSGAEPSRRDASPDSDLAPIRLTRLREQKATDAAIKAVEAVSTIPKRGRKKRTGTDDGPDMGNLPVDPNEPVYCYCRRVSYGEMVACDNTDCPIEWFHLGCVGFDRAPAGKWWCSPACKKISKG